MRSLFLIVLLLSLSVGFSTNAGYMFFFILIFLSSIRIVRLKMKFYFSNKIEDYIALFFFLVWLYGFIRGIILDNNITYVIANFTGMICYLFYFMLSLFRISKNEIELIILNASLFICLYSILGFISFIGGLNIPFYENNAYVTPDGQLRVMYFTTATIVYPLLGYSYYSFISKLKKTNWMSSYSFLFLLLSIFSLCIITASKGFILGCLIILGGITIIVLFRAIVRLKMNASILISSFILIFFSVLLYFLDYWLLVENLFSSEASGNSVRYDQLYYMLDDLSFWGKGLGATISGIVRSQDAPYGFELTYINLIHKFGVFSLFLFGGWAYMFFRSICILWKSKNIESVIVFSSLGYMYPSIGNPLLMHPTLVLLNCLTLYLIKIYPR